MDAPAPPRRLLDRVRDAIRVRHYSIRTEEAYVGWIRRFILFHHKRHPDSMGAEQVNAFLTYLATSENVASSTQAQALSALLFLYRHVLDDPLPWLQDVVRARKPRRLPVVLTKDEVRSILAEMSGTPKLVVSLLYGTGMRLLEGLRLRVKDVDFVTRVIVVRDGKGQKDRRTMLPMVLSDPVREHLEVVRVLHQRDLQEGYGEVAAACPLPEVPQRCAGVGLAIRLRCGEKEHRSAVGCGPAASCRRLGDSEGSADLGSSHRHRKAGRLPHLPTLLRHPFAARRL